MNQSCCGENSSCCDNKPDYRMCKMAPMGGNFDLEKVIKLAKDPRYICKCCGRMAHDKINLCAPVLLNKD